MASNVSEFFLLTNACGVVYLLWQDALDVQTLHLDILNLSVEGNAQLNAPNSITVAQGRLTDGPVMDLQGNVWVSWYVDDASATQQGFLLSQYTKEVGWADPTPRLALEGMDPSLGLMAAAGTDGVVLISQEINTRQLMATAFSSSIGWGAWQALDSQESPMSALMGLPRLVANTNGDVMVLWVEEQKSPNIAHPNRNETPDLFLPATGWLPTPEIVASAPDQFSYNDYVTPKGMILPNGEIVVLWKYTTNKENQVLSAVSQM